MKVIDPGHVYEIEALDGGKPQRIHFVKRQGPNYPGNEDSHGGPITQEFLRAILHRCEYMNNQGSCAETDIIIASLRTAIFAFEVRAARCRSTAIELPHLADIDAEMTCPTCGHIQCDQSRHAEGVKHWSEDRPVGKHPALGMPYKGDDIYREMVASPAGKALRESMKKD